MRLSPRDLVAKFGPLALVTYFAIFFATLAGFWWAIRLGWHPETATSRAGTWGAAYVATKLTQPLRIAATLALTPVVASVRDRLTRRPTDAADTELAPLPHDSRKPSSIIAPRAD